MSKQLSYVNGISDRSLIGMTIGDLFDQTVASFPNNDALISRHQNLRYTYKALQQEVNRCARGLLKLGVTKGERVGIWSPNNAQWCITQFATAKIGAILVNVNPSYRTHELEYALKQSATNTLIIEGEFKQSHYANIICELVPELKTSTPEKLSSKKLPELKRVICLDEKLATQGMYTWSNLMTLHDQVTEDELASVHPYTEH